MKSEIRAGIVSDIESLVVLSRATISECYRSFLGHAAVDAYIGSGAVDQYVRNNIDHCFVILVDGVVVGYSVCKDNLIDLMMVAHEFHGLELGTQLLRHTESELFQSYGELTLESFEGNKQANSFYLKNGWTNVKKYYDEASGFNKLVFRKSG